MVVVVVLVVGFLVVVVVVVVVVDEVGFCLMVLAGTQVWPPSSLTHSSFFLHKSGSSSHSFISKVDYLSIYLDLYYAKTKITFTELRICIFLKSRRAYIF